MELYVVNQFTHWSMSPHWSFFWIIYFFIWTFFRQVIHPKWYNNDIDLLVITWTSAVIPFWVENSIKVSQRNQIDVQNRQLEVLIKQQELLVKLAETDLTVGNKILALWSNKSDG